MRVTLTHSSKELTIVVAGEHYECVYKAIKNKFRLGKSFKAYMLDGREVVAGTILEDDQVLLVSKSFDLSGVKKEYIRQPFKKACVTIVSEDLCNDDAIRTLHQLARKQGVKRVIALPDLSWASPCPVGTHLEVENMIYPQWIGFDIGCGVTLFLLENKSLNREKIKKEIESQYEPTWDPISSKDWRRRFVADADKFQEIDISQHDINMGSIGGGNHFCEIQESRDGKLYLCVHSGSRSLGGEIQKLFAGKEFILKSAEGDTFNSYMAYQEFGIKWAYQNRLAIAHRFCQILNLHIDTEVTNLCHNFIEKQDSLYIHRKGAIPSTKGLAIIPGSRGSNSYLVRPKGAIGSLPHGAGRRYGRKAAEERFSKKKEKEDYVYCRDKKLLYQEAPGAYKDIDAVIRSLGEQVEVEEIFTPLFTCKC